MLKKNAFILPFSANYEADLLLKNRDKTKSAKKLYESELCRQKAVYLSLMGDVATLYLNILQYDELINIETQIVQNDKQILDSVSKKFSRGVVNSVSLNDANKVYETSKTELEKLIKERSGLLMNMTVFTGIPLKAGDNLQRGTFSKFEYTKQIPDNISSDVIFERPDVMAAEKNLEKAKIDIRIARKEFLPAFNITGLWIFNTIAPGTFFSWESSLALLLAGASQDIFTGGRKIANLRIKKAKYTELFENYKQVDLEAVKEVNTSLCFIKYDKNIENNSISKLNYEMQNKKSYEKKYDRGIISMPEYLEETNRLLILQKEYVQAKTQRLVNYFTLYKALGGKI